MRRLFKQLFMGAVILLKETALGLFSLIALSCAGLAFVGIVALGFWILNKIAP